ncbi:MAG: FAD-dependent oxidoreductase [Papillibacter sp.]|nr:FAD-dependent oxidoreductase [Papillibacter sp.]
MMTCDLIIIGGGSAGMAAALGALSEGIKNILLVERDKGLGGILNQCLHRGFGLSYFREELTGPEYAARFLRKINESGIEVLTDTSVISLSADKTAVLSGNTLGLKEVQAKAVILASGCRERPIGTLKVYGTRPSGIYTAGAAQRMVNLYGYDIGSSLVILGSGDVGLIMARQLTLLGKKVLAVIEKEDRCGGLERNRINCLEVYGIPLRTRTTVTQIHGTARIEGVTVLGLDTGIEEYIKCDGLITSVGLIPERELAEEAGYTESLPDWLFLCGNACYVHDTVDEVTVESELIGKAAARYILEGKAEAAFTPLPGNKSIRAAGGLICTACPKGCRLTKTDTGYIGALCGRKDPVIHEI